MGRRQHRGVAALLAAALLATPAAAARGLGVPVPGAGARVVELFFYHLTFQGTFVLQGEAGDDAPCVPFHGHVRCVVEAGPLSSVTLLYDPLPPTCTARAGVRVRVDGEERGWRWDAEPGPACVYLPLTGTP